MIGRTLASIEDRLGALSGLLLVFLTMLALGGCRGTTSPKASTGGGGDLFLLAKNAGLNEAAAAGPTRNLVKFEDASYVLDPAISPGGQQLAFARQAPAKNLPNGTVDFGSDIFTADRDGKNLKEVLHHAAVAEFLRSPAWLSDSQLLITVQGQKADRTSDFRTERLDLATGQRQRIIEGAINASLSRDRKQIVYVSVDPLTAEEALVVTGIDLTSTRKIADSNSGLGLFSSAVFSPDARTVSFAAVDLNAPALPPTPTPATRSSIKMTFAAASTHPFAQDVWSVGSDGRGLRRLSEIAENQPSLTWSGDGSVLFALGPTAFWGIDAATGKARQLGSGIPLGQIVWLGKS